MQALHFRALTRLLDLFLGSDRALPRALLIDVDALAPLLALRTLVMAACDLPLWDAVSLAKSERLQVLNMSRVTTRSPILPLPPLPLLETLCVKCEHMTHHQAA